ncbi:MAG: hypothetical protein R3B99_29270 [Polyangiales bacterium]
MRTRLSLLLLLLAACPADLSRYSLEHDGSTPTPRPDGGPLPDAGPLPDGATRDAGNPTDDCSPAPTCTDGCPMPWLLASVEDLQDGDACGGRILRWSLGDREECLCPSLTGGGVLDLPFAVGFLPPSTVVAVDQDGSVYGIDGNTDREVWNDVSSSSDRLVTDVFPIADPSGAPHVAVAYNRRGISSINEVVVYDATGNERTTWLGSTLAGGSGLASITVSSYDPRRYRAVKPNGGFAAAEIDPWTNTVLGMPYHTLARDGFYLLTISALYWDGNHRTVWTGRRTDLSPERSQVYTMRSTTPTEDNRVPLGDSCTKNEELLAYDATCNFVHAVPDPLDDFHSFAICETAPGERRVVRLYHFDGQCRDLAQDTRLFPRARFSKLAIALPRYQPE